MAYKREDHSQILLSNRLGQAIRNGELERVRKYIKQGVDLNRHYYSEMYPLQLACCHGHEEIMEELLKAGANPNHGSVWCKDSYSSQAMLMAAERHVLTLSMMQSLILNGAEVKFKGHRGMTILHYLARGQFNDTDDNVLSAVKLVLDNGASLYARDRGGYTPPYEACARGNMSLAKLFIDKGYDVNFKIGICHKKLLEGAADSCNIDLFDVLLNAGASRHLTHADLLKPCEQNDHAMIARILDTCDVDINLAIIDRYERPTIPSDVCKNYRITSETVRLLLDRGADIRAVSDTGDTALHYAVTQLDCKKIRQLLSYNAPLNIENNENQTPLAKLIQFPKIIDVYSWCQTHAQVRRYYAALNQTFKMLVIAGAKVHADVEHNLNQFHIKHPEVEMPDYKSSCIESLREMCRFVLRRTIPVPVDVSLRKLPIPKLLQKYLNFPEFDQLVNENNKLWDRS